MKKIYKQLYTRMILPIFLMLLGFGIVIAMGATQPKGGGHPTYINILGIVGFLVSMGLALVLMIRLYGKSMVVSALAKELKELKNSKDYYFGVINEDTPQKYLTAIAANLLGARYKDYTSEVNLRFDNYRFLLRKHFWMMDSTNIHVHMASTSTDISDVKAFYDDVADKELELNYGKFKGSHCGIVAVCAVAQFEEADDFLTFFNDVTFIRGIAVVKVLIDVGKNRIFISSGGAITENRGKRVVKKHVLKTKSLKKHAGSVERKHEAIKNLEEQLNDMDFDQLFSPFELSDEQKSFINSLKDGEVAFWRDERSDEAETDNDEEGIICNEDQIADNESIITYDKDGLLFYKEDNKILYLACTYDIESGTLDILGAKRMEWQLPKRAKIQRRQRQEITEKISTYLDKNNIPHDFVEMFFSPQNQTILVSKIKN